MPPKYPLKDMVSDKANVQKRFNELKRYFTRVFNDPADTGDLILNPILSQVYKMEDEFVALLPKVAAARKEVLCVVCAQFGLLRELIPNHRLVLYF